MELSFEELEDIIAAAYDRGRLAVVKSWNEADHPRGQPENAGEFAPSKGTASHAEDYAKNGTKSKAFKKWFGKSKVVDNAGDPEKQHRVPVTVYHGTRQDFESFKPSGEGAGIFFTASADVAKAYSLRYGVNPLSSEFDKLREKLVSEGVGKNSVHQHAEWKELTDRARVAGSKVVPVYLAIARPYELDGVNDSDEVNRIKDSPEEISKLKKKGYDGIVIRNALDRPTMAYTKDDAALAANRADVWVAFEPSQIKSIYNEGTFDSAHPSILKGGWDESLHPRGDDGKFINKGEISQAASNPGKAQELRAKVTDPAERSKLDAAIKGQQTGFSQGLGKIPPKNAPSRQPVSSNTTGEHPTPEKPSTQETVDFVRGLKSGVLDQSARQQLAERVQQHSAEELDDIRSHLGIRSGGRKSELATKILLAADGKEYPEQGFTGALPLKNGGTHHYEDGVLTHITAEGPQPGASRVTPDEAHALISEMISRGTILNADSREYIAHMLMNRMSYRDIAKLKNQLGFKASGRKAVFANRIQNLIEMKEHNARLDPEHPANKPDPAGTLGSLASRLQDVQAKQAAYGATGGINPARQKTVESAADRLRLALDSPFSSFSPEAALGEAKEAMNDLYSTSEYLAAAHLANLPLDPKKGKPIQQVAAAIHELAKANQGVTDNEPGQSKPINLLDGNQSNAVDHTHFIEGDTYPNREAIKKAGGTWDKVAKRWTIDEDGIDFLPDGVSAQPLEHRQPKPATEIVKPSEVPSVASQEGERPAPVAPPTVPADVMKKAEDFKKWHQQASRHPVAYDRMNGWDQKMMKEGDAKQRAISAKKMGDLIRKYPELADDYGHFTSKNPVLPPVPRPDEFLAKYGADADPHQVVRDYEAVGGHPNALHEHLAPGEIPGGYTRATMTQRALGAAGKVKEHLAGKKNDSVQTTNEIPEPTKNETTAGENAPALSGGSSRVEAESGSRGNGRISQEVSPKTLQRNNVITDPARIAEPETESKQRETDLEGLKPKPRSGAEIGNDVIESQYKREADKRKADEQYRSERSGNQNSGIRGSATSTPISAGDGGALRTDSSESQSIQENPQQPDSGSRPKNANATANPTPGRTDSAQAKVDNADRESVRDAADTVSRIEDIPTGERTADDRAALRDAKKMAGDAGVVAEHGVTGTPNKSNRPAPVDDHPEITADNPLGLPTVAERSSGNVSRNANQFPEEVKKPVETQANTASGNAPQFHETSPEQDAIKAKMDEALKESKNKQLKRADRAIWKRYYEEMKDKHSPNPQKKSFAVAQRPVESPVYELYL